MDDERTKELFEYLKNSVSFFDEFYEIENLVHCFEKLLKNNIDILEDTSRSNRTRKRARKLIFKFISDAVNTCKTDYNNDIQTVLHIVQLFVKMNSTEEG